MMETELLIKPAEKNTCNQLEADCGHEGSFTSTAPISSINDGTGYMPSKDASLYANFVVNALTPKKSADPFNIAISFGAKSLSLDLGYPCSALLVATFF